MPTLLLIEDDAESRRATAALFDGEWKVIQAGDGEEGIQSALEHRPDVILCDLLMPKTTGFQVCRAGRQQLPPARIIVFSGRDYGVDRQSAMDAGADEYLIKPLTHAQLMEAIDRVLPEPPDKPRKMSATPQFITPATRIKFWGVRGSIPVPGSGTVRYGGNTTCVEVRADGEIIILDAGSGIRPLGIALEKEFRDRPMKLTLLVTHSHWDHIQGLPFFQPAYEPKNEVRILGYEGARAGLASILAGQMETPYFPINLSDMPGNIAIEELRDMEFSLGRVRVQAKFLNHPGVCVGYRLFTSTGSMAFLPDNEPYEMLKMKQADRDGLDRAKAREFAAAERQKLVEFLRNADLLMIDSQYTDDEYEEHVGWGHGSLSSVVSLALDANVRKLSLFHHDPAHDDAMIDEMVESARHLVVESGKSLEIDAAREGAEVWLGAK